MRAFFEYAFHGNAETTVDLYTSVLEVLKWGAELWKDVPSEDKGAVFQPTFIRGVKCLRLDAFMKVNPACPVDNARAHMDHDAHQVCRENPTKFSHKELVAGADELLSELADAPTEPQIPDPAFFLAFFRYPIGQAHA